MLTVSHVICLGLDLDTVKGGGQKESFVWAFGVTLAAQQELLCSTTGIISPYQLDNAIFLK